MHKEKRIPMYDKRSQNQPQPKSVYEECGFKNPTIDKFAPNKVKDVEMYDPITG